MPTTKLSLAAGVLAGGLLVSGLAGCAGTSGQSGTAAGGSASAGSSGVSADASAAATTEAGGVHCSGTSCSLTLSHDDAQAKVLGTTVSLGAVQNGKATLGVAGHDVSCAQGQKVTAGPLTLTCSTVTDNSVTLTASLG